jgi:hypothetical protein
LAVFASNSSFGGSTLTEFNPDHVDEEGTMATTFIQGIAHAFARPEPAIISQGREG